jgi:hypothetical protein
VQEVAGHHDLLRTRGIPADRVRQNDLASKSKVHYNAVNILSGN